MDSNPTDTVRLDCGPGCVFRFLLYLDGEPGRSLRQIVGGPRSLFQVVLMSG